MTNPFTSNLQTRAWLGVPIVGALGILLFFALPPASIEQNIVYDVVGLAAVGASIVALARYRPAGWQPWLFMAVGQLAFVIGDCIWTWYSSQGLEPFPSVADVSYLIGYPLMGLGLLDGIRRRIQGGDKAGLLDGAILATGVAVIWWTFVLGPVVAVSDPEPVAFGISIAYPIGDLILIGMAMAMLMTPGARSSSFRLLIGSLVVLLIGDLVFNIQTLEDTYVEGGLLDGVWLLAYLCFATSAAHPSMVRLFEPRPIAVTLLGPVRLVLLAAAMLVGPALLVWSRQDADGIVLVVAAATAILSALVITRLAGMVRILASDIARREVLEEQLSFQAFHDPLTGLSNRRGFMDDVAAALATGEATAALFLDLDDFKNVNDNMGHDAGDALLKDVGQRIVSSLRPGDVASRLGGDEFAVLLPATADLRTAEAIADRLMAALAAPARIEGVDVPISASVGVAIRAAGEQLGVDDLIRRADVAMYHAKARGKHRSASYSPDLESGEATAAPRLPVRRSAPAA